MTRERPEGGDQLVLEARTAGEEGSQRGRQGLTKRDEDQLGPAHAVGFILRLKSHGREQ